MSAKTSHSTLTDVPNITNAVERLQELGVRMKGEEFGFSDGDINNIDNVIDAIKEVETECYKLHEKLETETIKASVLRHKLHFFPGEIRNEIQAAVDSARHSNAEELQTLQNKLNAILHNTEYLTKRHKELEEDNSKLHPQRDGVRQVHEEIITQLNQRMAEKASKQITLNETRDSVRDTNQKIVDLEDGILQLKEDLIQERADARMEKKRLKKAVYDTTVKTKEQKEVNVAKKKEMDELHERVMDSEGKLEVVRKSVRRYETSKQRMEGQERALSKQYNKELSENDQLRLDGTQLTKKLTEDKEAFRIKRKRLEERMKQLEICMKEETKRNQELNGQKIEMCLDLEEKTKIRRHDEMMVKEQNQVLQKSKENLAFKAEEVGRLQQENIDIEKRIVDLGESHHAIVATLQKQAEEYRDQLTRERKDRMDLQDQRDDVQKDLDDMRIKHMRSMNEMNKKINDGKQLHDELTHEGTSLQKEIRMYDENVQKLTAELSQSEKEHAVKKQQLQAEIQRMQTEIKSMRGDILVRDATIVEKTPGFQELEATFEDTTKKFEETKKHIVSMKNEKQGLDDMVKQSERQLQKMVRPQDELNKELKKQREKALNNLKEDSEEVKEIERNIYTVGCKLETALLQNHRFTKANDKLSEEIADLKEQTKENESLVCRLGEDFGGMRGTLEEQWSADHMMEKEHAAKDSLLLDELGSLLTTARRREEIIGGITDHLYSELTVLAEFLDNVARRRPKDTRQGKRPKHGKNEAPFNDGEGNCSQPAGDRVKSAAARSPRKSPSPHT